MDVIANYDGLAGRYSVWLPFSDLPSQPTNTWRRHRLPSDNKNPGILDSGEQTDGHRQPHPAVTGPTNRWLSVATDTGVSFTVTF